MHKIPAIIPERVDDLPLLLEQMQRMSLPTVCDDQCPMHREWFFGTDFTAGY